ncbi:hypothetical protein ACUOFC_68615, partial [Escherichia sp. TWPC-MK]
VQNVESSKDEPVETESASEEETKSKVKQETVKVNLFSGVNPQNLIKINRHGISFCSTYYKIISKCKSIY